MGWRRRCGSEEPQAAGFLLLSRHVLHARASRVDVVMPVGKFSNIFSK